ncbi:hypothetical protein TELCIR_12881 [Teladorsagia circumcincta]|uniref:SCP domain-containing protein n=1 Tax=Teladorsagia circumcincta TaxID=45464 RepID=A0A2G9U594_TELCI|nr:hypothetical protein TELCIR_12881 [Teladorsagia circumcincta]
MLPALVTLSFFLFANAAEQCIELTELRDTIMGFLKDDHLLSSTIDFGCGCVHSPSPKYDFMTILCVDLTHPNG